MCGILGARHDWLLRCGLEPETALRAALERLRWRGPDGTDVVRIGDWWLGCARLAITQPRSSQPVVRRGERFAGVLNGAITNARDLWRLLLPRAERRAAPPNDAWLPLLAVQHAHTETLRGLRGHHAYAVADATNSALVLGQDRFGEKPLFCLHGRVGDARTLHAFASSPAALRELGMPPLRTPRRLGDWFRQGFASPVPHRFSTRLCLDELPQRGTPFVAAASRPSWCEPWPASLQAPAAVPPPEPPSLRTALIASVARCIDTTVPVGLMLSGGVDSSCLAAALRDRGRSVAAFQFCALGEPADERAVARAVAAHCGLPFHPVDAGPDVLDALGHLTVCAGVPLGDPSVLAVHAVARAAAAAGVRVLLGGEGADELFLGYRRYRALAHLPRAPWLHRRTNGWSMRYAARWLRAASATDPATALLAVTPPAFGRTVLAPALTRRRAWRDVGPFSRTPAAAPIGDPVLRAREQDLAGYLRTDLLPKVDVACMAAGIEARAPFLEGDLLPFGATRGALGKRPLRTAFANQLPAAVFRQRKRGFALPLDRWFRGDCQALELLAEPRSRQRSHLRPGGLATAIDRHRRGQANIGHGLYLLLSVELWWRGQEQDSAPVRTNPASGA